MGEGPLEETNEINNDETLKHITDMLKEVENASKKTVTDNQVPNTRDGADVVPHVSVNENLPEKTGFWVKLKNVLFYEIKIELTPYQQKIEREINDFLHQEITWKSLKEAALSEVPITFKGKRVF